MAAVTDPDIWRSAAMLIYSHRKEAPSYAAERAQAFKANGDMAGWSIWSQISLAATELLRFEPGPDDRVN